MQGIASFLYQNSVRSSVGNLNRIAEVGVLILDFEKESFTIAFWTRLSLIRLAQWFKDWTEDQAIRDEQSMPGSSKQSGHAKTMLMRAINECIHERQGMAMKCIGAEK